MRWILRGKKMFKDTFMKIMEVQKNFAPGPLPNPWILLFYPSSLYFSHQNKRNSQSFNILILRFVISLVNTKLLCSLPCTVPHRDEKYKSSSILINVNVSPSRLFFSETCNWIKLKMPSLKSQTRNKVKKRSNADWRQQTNAKVRLWMCTRALVPAHMHLHIHICARMHVYPCFAWLCPPRGL